MGSHCTLLYWHSSRRAPNEQQRLWSSFRLVIGAGLFVVLSAVIQVHTADAARLVGIDRDAYNDPTELFVQPRCNAVLRGELFDGDAERLWPLAEQLASQIREGWAAKGRTGRLALCLSSRGGSLREAYRLSNVFSGWMKVVGDGDECVSACAMLFMRESRRGTLFTGGGVAEDSRNDGRYLHVRGKLGFHAPSLEIPGPAIAMRSKRELRNAYARSLHTLREFLLPMSQDPTPKDEMADHVNRERKEKSDFSFVGWGVSLDESIPLDVLLAFLVIPHDEVYWVTTVEEAFYWGIELFGFAPPKRLTAEMLMMACANVALTRCRRAMSQNRQCTFGLDAHETSLFDAHSAKGQAEHAQIMKEYKPSKLSLWPRQAQGASGGVFSVQGFRVAKGSKSMPLLPCAVRATWQGQRLFDMEIQTFNGMDTSWLGATMPFSAADIETIKDNRGSTENHLRPWKMLPLGTRLVDLGKGAPWGWLENGPEFFDRPASW